MIVRSGGAPFFIMEAAKPVNLIQADTGSALMRWLRHRDVHGVTMAGGRQFDLFNGYL
jgi:hypothetical protein|tara:strand:+ start:1403 stop:1576 length:174 start_codon:yes stop_codon:yes gene_type:complete